MEKATQRVREDIWTRCIQKRTHRYAINRKIKGPSSKIGKRLEHICKRVSKIPRSLWNGVQFHLSQEDTKLEFFTTLYPLNLYLKFQGLTILWCTSHYRQSCNWNNHTGKLSISTKHWRYGYPKILNST